jgi:hypothetical protein
MRYLVPYLGLLRHVCLTSRLVSSHLVTSRLVSSRLVSSVSLVSSRLVFSYLTLYIAYSNSNPTANPKEKQEVHSPRRIWAST